MLPGKLLCAAPWSSFRRLNSAVLRRNCISENIRAVTAELYWCLTRRSYSELKSFRLQQALLEHGDTFTDYRTGNRRSVRQLRAGYRLRRDVPSGGASASALPRASRPPFKSSGRRAAPQQTGSRSLVLQSRASRSPFTAAAKVRSESSPTTCCRASSPAPNGTSSSAV